MVTCLTTHCTGNLDASKLLMISSLKLLMGLLRWVSLLGFVLLRAVKLGLS